MHRSIWNEHPCICISWLPGFYLRAGRSLEGLYGTSPQEHIPLSTPYHPRQPNLRFILEPRDATRPPGRAIPTVVPTAAGVMDPDCPGRIDGLGEGSAHRLGPGGWTTWGVPACLAYPFAIALRIGKLYTAQLYKSYLVLPYRTHAAVLKPAVTADNHPASTPSQDRIPLYCTAWAHAAGFVMCAVRTPLPHTGAAWNAINKPRTDRSRSQGRTV